MTKLQPSYPNGQLLGSQEPSVRIYPDFSYYDGPDAVAVLGVGKLYPDPWQGNVLYDWMGRSDAGKWTAPTAGLSVPRQNGKTLDVIGRIASGMILYGDLYCTSAKNVHRDV